MIVSTEAIVLHSRKYGDTSKIATLFTKEFGKLSIIAKGAFKPKSKFGSSLEPLSYIRINIYKKDNSKLHLLSDSEVITPLRKIHQSPDNLSSGLILLESVSKTINENDPNNELFELILICLIELNKKKYSHLNLLTYFYLNLFRILGFEINFNYNISGIKKNIKFSLNSASIFQGGKNGSRLLIISSDNWEKMRNIYQNNINDLNKVSISKFDFSDLYDFFMSYLGYHFEKEFNLKSGILLTL